MIDPRFIVHQLHVLNAYGFDGKLTAAADKHGLNRFFVFAIASRETNCVNELGDIQNSEAHGVGIMQIDIQHELARTMRDDGTWKTNPDPLIDFGCALLASGLARVKVDLPDLAANEQLRVVADGYNEGMGRAEALEKAGADPDSHTTGHNYGRDVMERMAIFASICEPHSSAN